MKFDTKKYKGSKMKARGSSLMCFSLGMEHYYGMAAFFITILHNIFLLYHVDLFVSVYKIDKTSFWVGETLFLVWNSVNDLLFGWISDKKYLGAKKDHAYSHVEVVEHRLRALQQNGPLFAIVFLLFWFPWGMPGLQFVTCLCLYDGFLTVIDLHHSALLADLAVSSPARARLNQYSSFFSAFGSLSVFLSYAFWSKEYLTSFRVFCSILSLLSILGFLFVSMKIKTKYLSKQKTFSNEEHDANYSTSYNKEIDNEDAVDEEELTHHKPNILSFMSQLKRHRNFKWFVAMNIIQVFHCHFNSNFFPLFLEHLLGDIISPWMGSCLIGLSFLAPHVNNLWFLRLCGRYGTYQVIRFLFFTKLMISVLMFAVGPSHTLLLCVFIASNRVFTEGTCKLLNLVISDLVDEDFVLHHRQKAVSALIFGSTALLSKPGQTLAPLVGMWLLTLLTGHDVFKIGGEMGSLQLNVKDMDPDMRLQHQHGCFLLLVYVPVGCALLQLLVWSQFSLHGSRLMYIKHKRNEVAGSVI